MKRNLKLDCQELVCPHIFDKLGPKGALTYIDEKLIEVLRWMKEGWFSTYEIVCNDYNVETEEDQVTDQSLNKEEPKVITQHGLICNLCSRELQHTFNLEVYVTDQTLGKAVILKFFNPNINDIEDSGKIVKEFGNFSTDSDSPIKKIPYPVYIKALDKEYLFLSVRLRKDGGGKIIK